MGNKNKEEGETCTVEDGNKSVGEEIREKEMERGDVKTRKMEGKKHSEGEKRRKERKKRKTRRG